MAAQSPTMWRWHFATWENPTVLQEEAEIQSGLTSTKFSPKGRFQASKAYTWACGLLGRVIPGGETIDFDQLYPLACRIKTVKEAGKDFVKILDVESWVEGAEHVPALTARLRALREQVLQQPPPAIPAAAQTSQGTPPAPPPVPPGMQTWGSVQPQQSPPSPPARTGPGF
jgi:hypothetical protein